MRKKATKIKLSIETVRRLTPPDLTHIVGGLPPNETWTGFGSLNGKSCNTCNLGFP